MTKKHGRAINVYMTKGDDTKQYILAAGLGMASELGLEDVTIGALAKRTGMSKSGLFAHFQSKENLQIAIMEHAAELFKQTVIMPVLQVTAGISRINALLNNWISWGSKLPGGCIFVVAGNEFTERPGKVRDFLLNQQMDWHQFLCRVAQSAIDVGDFRSDSDCDQFAFEFYSHILGFHLYHKLLQSQDCTQRQQTALARLLDSYR